MAKHWNTVLELANRRLTTAADALRYVEDETSAPISDSVMTLIREELLRSIVAVKLVGPHCDRATAAGLAMADDELLAAIDGLAALDAFHALDIDGECAAQQRTLLSDVAERVYRAWSLVQEGFARARPNNIYRR